MNDPTSFEWRMLTACCSVLAGVLVSVYVSRRTGLEDVLLADKNARKIARQKSELALNHDWTKARRRSMIEKLGLDLLTTARDCVARVDTLLKIDEARKGNDQLGVQIFEPELATCPQLARLLQELQDISAAARLLDLEASTAIAKHNSMLEELLLAPPVDRE